MALPAAGRVAKWIAAQVFQAVINSDSSAEDEDDTVFLQCGRTVFDNVPANLRTELWLSQLHSGSGLGAAAAATYELVLEQGALDPEVQSEIDKDTHRTFPGHRRLGTPAGQRAMLNVLTAYACLDPEIGYCQGMNFLTGLLLAFLPREADAYGALVLLMQGRGLRELYKPNMSLLQVRLWQLGKLLPPQLADHLESHCVLPVLYASSWFLTCFASDFPIAFAARVLDVVITDCYAAPMMKVAVGILEHCGELVMEMGDMELILQHIKQDVPKWPKPILQDMLTTSLSKPWTRQQLALLSEMNGAETVGEAVSRVNTLNRSRGGDGRGGDQSMLAAEAAAAALAAATAAAGRGSEASGGGSEGPPGELERSELSATRTLSQFSSVPTLGALASFTTIGGASRMNSFLVAGKAQRWPASAGAPASPPASPPRTAAAAAAAAAFTGVAVGAGDAIGQGPPSNGARPVGVKPLPPPPSSPRDVVSWEGWGPTVASLDTVSPEQLRIETVIRDVHLDPALTQALSGFHPASSEGRSPPRTPSLSHRWEPQTSDALSALAVAGGGEGASRSGSATSTRQSKDLAGLEQSLSLQLWGARSSSGNSCQGSMPSPFDSSPSWVSSGHCGSGAGGLPSPAQPINLPTSSGTGAREPSGGPGPALEDCFGSFQNASTGLRSLPPGQHAAAKAAGPAEGQSGSGDSGAQAAAAAAAAKPPVVYRSPSEELLHASGLSQLLGRLSMGSNSSSRPGSSSGLQAPEQKQQGQRGEAAAAEPGPRQHLGPPSVGMEGGVTQAADDGMDNWSSWRSGDSQPSLKQPLTALPVPAAAPASLAAAARGQPPQLGCSVSQLAGLIQSVASQGAGRGGPRQRASSEQHEHTARAQQVQLECFLQTAAATPQKGPSLLAMKRASLDSPARSPMNSRA